MFQKEVKTQDGHVKVVVAGSEEELAEGVAAVKGDRQAVSPDLHSPEVANKIVSPDNRHTEPAFVQPAEPEQPEPEEEKAPKPKPHGHSKKDKK